MMDSIEQNRDSSGLTTRGPAAHEAKMMRVEQASREQQRIIGREESQSVVQPEEGWLGHVPWRERPRSLREGPGAMPTATLIE